MTIDVRVYAAGSTDSPATDSPATDSPATGTTSWVELAARTVATATDGSWCRVDLVDPTPGQWQQVVAAFGLPAHVHDMIEAHHPSPTLEVIAGFKVGLVRTLHYGADDDIVRIGDLAFVVGARVLVAVRHGVAAELADLRIDAERAPGLEANGALGAMYAGYRRIVAQYRTVVLELERDVDRLEQQVFAAGRGSHTEAIYRLTRQLIECRRATSPLVDTMSDLLETDAGTHSDAYRPFLQHVVAHVERVNEHLGSLDALLGSIMSAEQGNISVQQNDDMRKISAYAALAAVPTLLAGIYGMNFTDMPELRWSFGYPLVILVMVVACALLFGSFKKHGWL